MRKSRFNETQIVSILKDVESGVSLDEALLEHDLTAETYYRWRSLYSSPEVQQERDNKICKELKAENEKLRRMYVELSLELADLKQSLQTKSE